MSWIPICNKKWVSNYHRLYEVSLDLQVYNRIGKMPQSSTGAILSGAYGSGTFPCSLFLLLLSTFILIKEYVRTVFFYDFRLATFIIHLFLNWNEERILLIFRSNVHPGDKLALSIKSKEVGKR